MEKTHHIFITIKGDELTTIVYDYLERHGDLKNIPKTADVTSFDEDHEVCLEFIWDENTPNGGKVVKNK